jgi:hypothetical protein
MTCQHLADTNHISLAIHTPRAVILNEVKDLTQAD